MSPADRPTETEAHVRVAEVVLDAKSGGGEGPFTYRLETAATRGDAVLVPLGARLVLGTIWRVFEATEADLGFPFAKLRGIHTVIESLRYPGPLCDVVDFVSRTTLTGLPGTLSVMIPPGVRERLVQAWTIADTSESEHPLPPSQAEVLKVLQESGGILAETATKRLPASSLKILRMLRAKGLVRQQMALAPFSESKEREGLYRLAVDEARIEAFVRAEAKKKPAQALTLITLQEANRSAFSLSDIKALAKVTERTIASLVEAGLIDRLPDDNRALDDAPTPNAQQIIAIEAISEAVRLREPQGFLLFGVTGSGKTEVYLRAAAEALKAGRQVLYLVPEIALATQVIGQLRSRFGRRVAVQHSDLTPKERLESWIAIRRGEAPLVVGARSAVFTPLDNLGLIVLDEEHEGSYKQDSAPRYHARDVVKELARLHGCPYVLGSATLSIESFFAAENDRLTLLTLPERAAEAKLPSVVVVDLRRGYQEGRPAILSDALLDRMESALLAGHQAILFLNRRAYSPFIVCRDCGHEFLCPNCAVSLSYSRKHLALRCHHCGYKEAAPEICPECAGHKLSPFGVGTEKVEEAVAKAFPDARVARLDRDVTAKKGELERILAAFRGRQLDVLVGTQIVAKGLHFPGVTVVGVISADTALNLPDFRATERTFQLLSQVAGRAGRGESPGEVVIQTLNPDHIAVRAAQSHNYHGLYSQVLRERQDAVYPPFCQLINVIFSGERLSAVMETAEHIAEELQNMDGLEILGPAECPLERLQTRYRHHLLIKSSPDADLSQLEPILGTMPENGVHIQVDVDPYNLS